MAPAGALHHIALGAHDVACVAAFWRDLLGLPELRRHTYEDGELRSIWLDLGAGAILMIEHTTEAAAPLDAPVVGHGPFLLAIRVTPEERQALCGTLAAHGHPVEDATDYTSYVRDPEGNRVGLSTYLIPS